MGLFLGAIRSGATPNQVCGTSESDYESRNSRATPLPQMSYWMDKGALSLQGLICCFAMTEMRGVSRVHRADCEHQRLTRERPNAGLERRRTRDDGHV